MGDYSQFSVQTTGAFALTLWAADEIVFDDSPSTMANVFVALRSRFVALRSRLPGIRPLTPDNRLLRKPLILAIDFRAVRSRLTALFQPSSSATVDSRRTSSSGLASLHSPLTSWLMSGTVGRHSSCSGDGIMALFSTGLLPLLRLMRNETPRPGCWSDETIAASLIGDGSRFISRWLVDGSLQVENVSQ